MKNERKILELTFNQSRSQRRLYRIKNQHDDDIAYIDVAVYGKSNNNGEYLNAYYDFELVWNGTYASTEKERNSARFLFGNMVKTIGYDISHMIDPNLPERINSILPIEITIDTIKGEELCQKEVNSKRC